MCARSAGRQFFRLIRLAPGLAGDAPRPCGAPSGFFPRSLRYSVRHKGGRQVKTASICFGFSW